MSEHMTTATHLRQFQIIEHLTLNRLLHVALCQVNNVVLRNARCNLTSSHFLKVIFILIGNHLSTSEASDWNDHRCIN